MNNPLISVIVPVYNSEKYLHRCIDSILSQTYTNFELLLVDDGSRDRSAAICDEYALKDSRVRVFHKENGGVSSARNLGLDNANGEWVAFVDSDDWVEKNYFFNLQTDSDVEFVIVQGFVKYGVQKLSVFKIDDGAKNNIANLLDQMVYPNLFVAPWGRMFSLSIIKKYKIRFPIISYFEDLIFNLSYLSCICVYSIVPDFSYHYENNDNSLSHKSKPINDYFTLVEHYLLCIEDIRNKGCMCTIFYREMNNRIMHESVLAVVYVLYSCVINQENRIEVLKKIHRIVETSEFGLEKYRCSPFHRRVYHVTILKILKIKSVKIVDFALRLLFLFK